MPTSIIPQSVIDHIINTLQGVSRHPEMLDVDGPRPHSTLKTSETYLVTMGEGAHVELIFSPHPKNGIFISSITAGMFTDNDLPADNTAYPEVRFQLYHDSEHSLAWGKDATIDDVVTPDRM